VRFTSPSFVFATARDLIAQPRTTQSLLRIRYKRRRYCFKE
jgi:hypothetical protein